jgi:hypothetical protein
MVWILVAVGALAVLVTLLLIAPRRGREDAENDEDQENEDDGRL